MFLLINFIWLIVIVFEEKIDVLEILKGYIYGLSIEIIVIFVSFLIF